MLSSSTNIQSLESLNNVSDDEIFEILGLHNESSDNELQAQIISFIKKYKDIPGADEVYSFFCNIYDRFFDDGGERGNHRKHDDDDNDDDNDDYADYADDYNVNEGFDTMPPGSQSSPISVPISVPASVPGSVPVSVSVPVPVPTSTPLTQNIDYLTDPQRLNPLLKQTTTTLVTIDSQYRENKQLSASNYTFNLSRPLRDVVALKLYAVQIPYTWYTISHAFGGNFFYLKGNSPGINDGNFDYQISIPSGNYNPTTIIAAINNQIQINLIPSYPDTDFSGSFLIYDPVTIQTTFNLRIQKVYYKSDYILEFPNLSSNPHIPFFTIPKFLGFSNQNTFDLKSIYSKSKLRTATPGLLDRNSNANTIKLDLSNNYFTIIQYANSNVGYTIDTSYQIQLSLPIGNWAYNQNAIYFNLQSVLGNHPVLDNKNSSITQEISQDGSSNMWKLSLCLNRNTSQKTQNIKLFVQFPDESSYTNPIWTNGTNGPSFFNFPNTMMEIGNVVAQHQPDRTNYVIPNDVSFSIVCSKPYYDISSNNIIVTVSGTMFKSPSFYLVPDYFAAINTGLSIANDSTIDISFNPNGILSKIATKAYYDTSSLISNFSFDINKTITEDTLQIDFSGSFLDLGYEGFGNKPHDLHNQNTITGKSVSSAMYVVFDTNNCIQLTAKSNGPNQRMPTINIYVSPGNYEKISDLATAIQSAFTEYRDIDGDAIFQQTTCTGIISLYTTTDTRIGGGIGIYAITTISIKMVKILTERDYKVVFYGNNQTDSSCNWSNDLYLDSSYSLASYQVQNNSTAPGMYASIFSGYKSMDCVTFNIDSSNNKFQLTPINPGVIGSEPIVFTIPKNTYSLVDFMIAMNFAINNNPLTTIGSHIGIDSITGYVYIDILVNKVYTAQDYRLVFYDVYSFVKCVLGVSNATNIAWDNTMGWLLGYQSLIEYPLNGSFSSPVITNEYSYDSSSNIVSIKGDTLINLTPFNYALIVLDEYVGSHLNNGLVTVMGDTDTIQSSSSYAAYYTCVSGINQMNPSTYNSLTRNQIYSITQIQQNAYSHSPYLYTSGPVASGIFAMVPIKLPGLTPGAVFTEFGGTLQSNIRQFFGPVNIQRMSVRLLNNLGNQLDLNGANWSFTMLVEQLYNPNLLKT